MMKLKSVLTVIVGCALAAGLSGGEKSPLDDLMPRPVRIDRRSGERAVEKPRFVRGEVPGAPAAVREEAYVLDIAADGITVTAGDPRGERYAQVTLD